MLQPLHATNVSLAEHPTDSLHSHAGSLLHTQHLDELSRREKKELRKQRFNALSNDPLVNTFATLDKMKEEKEKKLLRAQKFGIETKDLEEEKRRIRAEKFGLNA